MGLIGALATIRMLQQSDYAFKTDAHGTVPALRANQENFLDRVNTPTPGTIRTVICPADNAPALTPDTTAMVLRSVRGQKLSETTLTADQSRGRRCLDGLTHASGELLIYVRTTTANADRVRGLEVFSHRSITPWLAWPVIAWILGISLLLWAGHRKEQLTTTVSEVYRQSEHPAVSETSTPQEPTAPVRWPFGWIFAIGAYGVVHIGTLLLTILLMVVRRTGQSVDGLSLAISTLIQHGLLIAVSLVLLGAFSKRDDGTRVSWISAAGFQPLTRKSVALSVLAATVLVGIAMASTLLIPDLNKSPMGQILERSPARYAIAFGALIAPLSEELYFRGVLIAAFGKKNVWFGVLGSVLFFTAAHVAQLWGSWAGLVPICAVGITNAVIRAKSKGLEQPWLIHTLYNGALTISLYFTG